MNLNQRDNEYNLNGSMTDELIRIYGVPMKLLLSDRINKDEIFGDHSHIKVDDSKVFLIYGMPENSEDFDEFEKLQTQFNLPVGQTMDIFVSKISMFELLQKSNNSKNEINFETSLIQKLLSSLLILPSGKIMEITYFDMDPPGLNNLFTFNKAKNVYKLKCKSYVHDGSNEIDVNTHITNKDGEDAEPIENPLDNPLESLEKYIDEMMEKRENQEEIAKEFSSVGSENDPVFGRF